MGLKSDNLWALCFLLCMYLFVPSIFASSTYFHSGGPLSGIDSELYTARNNRDVLSEKLKNTSGYGTFVLAGAPRTLKIFGPVFSDAIPIPAEYKEPVVPEEWEIMEKWKDHVISINIAGFFRRLKETKPEQFHDEITLKEFLQNMYTGGLIGDEERSNLAGEITLLNLASEKTMGTLIPELSRYRIMLKTTMKKFVSYARNLGIGFDAFLSILRGMIRLEEIDMSIEIVSAIMGEVKEQKQEIKLEKEEVIQEKVFQKSTTTPDVKEQKQELELEKEEVAQEKLFQKVAKPTEVKEQEQELEVKKEESVQEKIQQHAITTDVKEEKQELELKKESVRENIQKRAIITDVKEQKQEVELGKQVVQNEIQTFTTTTDIEKQKQEQELKLEKQLVQDKFQALTTTADMKEQKQELEVKKQLIRDKFQTLTTTTDIEEQRQELGLEKQLIQDKFQALTTTTDIEEQKEEMELDKQLIHDKFQALAITTDIEKQRQELELMKQFSKGRFKERQIDVLLKAKSANIELGRQYYTLEPRLILTKKEEVIGQEVHFSLILQNVGNAVATSPMIVDVFPIGMKVIKKSLSNHPVKPILLTDKERNYLIWILKKPLPPEDAGYEPIVLEYNVQLGNL